MRITIDIDDKELKMIYANYGQSTLDEAITRIAGDLGLRIKRALDLSSIQSNPSKVTLESK